MTKIITRYFDTVEAGRMVKRELVYAQQFSSRILRVFESSEGMTEVLIAQGVEAATAEAYAARMANGGAVLLVRAGFKPLCVAQITRDVSAQMGAVDMGGLVEEVYIKDSRRPSLSVLTDHPHMMSRPLDSAMRSTYMANWPIPLISRRKPFNGFVFPPHARMANFPIPLISRRKPFTGTLIGRHTRMANWPFPHLINGKPGTNALIPGGPRMANFPIPLISQRKPSDNFAFPRHARMANFPIGLISKRKPSDAFAFPRHARMANFPIPLIIRRTETSAGSGAEFSERRGYFGLPTLIRR